MIEFGKTLKLAREAKGLTVDDIAEITRIMPRTIENLEKENFSDIVAPIYGRGFVKLYCEAVGIDHRPMVDEFMEIYNGNREAQIAERPLSITARSQAPEIPPADTEPPATEIAEAVTASEPPARADTPILAAAVDLFSDNAAFAPVQKSGGGRFAASPAPEAEPAVAGVPPPKPSAGANFSRYASPFDNSEEPSRFRFRMPAIPPAVWRIGVLAAVAAVLLWALLTGVRALYRTTMPRTAETASVQAEETSGDAVTGNSAATAPKASAPRKPVDIPQLYID